MSNNQKEFITSSISSVFKQWKEGNTKDVSDEAKISSLSVKSDSAMVVDKDFLTKDMAEQGLEVKDLAGVFLNVFPPIMAKTLDYAEKFNRSSEATLDKPLPDVDRQNELFTIAVEDFKSLVLVYYAWKANQISNARIWVRLERTIGSLKNMLDLTAKLLGPVVSCSLTKDECKECVIHFSHATKFVSRFEKALSKTENSSVSDS